MRAGFRPPSRERGRSEWERGAPGVATDNDRASAHKIVDGVGIAAHPKPPQRAGARNYDAHAAEVVDSTTTSVTRETPPTEPAGVMAKVRLEWG